MNKLTFGSCCSGIEASRLALDSDVFKQVWSSEIADFPSKVLHFHYPDVPNVGNMMSLPHLIENKSLDAPDFFCGGTPCQAFSLAGWKNGLNDERGLLTMTYIDILNSIDKIRNKQKKRSCLSLWENVEGVLNDKTNAFGNFIAGLAGLDSEISNRKWKRAGVLKGPKRTVCWRVLDAKHFGLPQQRRRLYVIAGDPNSNVESILFEKSPNLEKLKSALFKSKPQSKKTPTLFDSVVSTDQSKYVIGDSIFEFFREYTDCLYAAYGTKWNGNAAAYNGSLYVSENDRIRRFTPLECERLMGFPDCYTDIKGCRDTNRYQAIGNSWAVPVIRWIGKKVEDFFNNSLDNFTSELNELPFTREIHESKLYQFEDIVQTSKGVLINTSCSPNAPERGTLEKIVQTHNVPEKFYLSPEACRGILRRKNEKTMSMNERLEYLLIKNSKLLKTA